MRDNDTECHHLANKLDHISEAAQKSHIWEMFQWEDAHL